MLPRGGAGARRAPRRHAEAQRFSVINTTLLLP